MNSPDIHSDKELFELISEGDEAAFAVLFYRYGSILHPFVAKLLKSEMLAEEIVQETFLKVWIHRDKLMEIENPKSWIFRIAANFCHNQFKRKATGQKVFSQIQMRTAKFEGEAVSYRDLQSALQKAVDKLSPQRKLMYRLNREEGLRFKEIAEQLGVSVTTVRKTVYTSLALIREHLVKEGFTVNLLLLWLLSCASVYPAIGIPHLSNSLHITASPY
jgi:RNA polymerase sigma-70 factor (family 1)